jgi:DNA-binding XRE family transcriptional regulator
MKLLIISSCTQCSFYDVMISKIIELGGHYCSEKERKIADYKSEPKEIPDWCPLSNYLLDDLQPLLKEVESFPIFSDKYNIPLQKILYPIIIKKVREIMDLTCSELAEKVGLSSLTIQAAELGEINLTSEFLEKILSASNVPKCRTFGELLNLALKGN